MTTASFNPQLVDDMIHANRMVIGSSVLNGHAMSPEEYTKALQNPYSIAYKEQAKAIAIACAIIAQQLALDDKLYESRLKKEQPLTETDASQKPVQTASQWREGLLTEEKLQVYLVELARLEAKRNRIHLTLSELINNIFAMFDQDEPKRLQALSPIVGKINVWMQDNTAVTVYPQVMALFTDLNTLRDPEESMVLHPHDLAKNLQALQQRIALKIAKIEKEEAILLNFVNLGVITPDDFQQYQALRVEQLQQLQQVYREFLKTVMEYQTVNSQITELDSHLANKPSYTVQPLTTQLNAVMATLQQFSQMTTRRVEFRDKTLEEMEVALAEKLRLWAKNDDLSDPSLSELIRRRAELEGLIVCPITREPMRDPWRAADGVTYERAAADRWLKRCVSSPTTGVRLANQELTENAKVRAKIAEIKQHIQELNIKIAKLEAARPEPVVQKPSAPSLESESGMDRKLEEPSAPTDISPPGGPTMS